jgi:hypothetical protein
MEEIMKHKCSWPDCAVVLTTKLIDEKGNLYCYEHFQLVLKAKKEGAMQEDNLPKKDGEKKILHG